LYREAFANARPNKLHLFEILPPKKVLKHSFSNLFKAKNLSKKNQTTARVWFDRRRENNFQAADDAEKI
jgi:hypothetical protein